MSKFLLISLIPIIFYYLFLYFYCNDDYLPLKFEKDGYFGEGDIKSDDKTIKTFKININDEEIDELKRRVEKSLSTNIDSLEMTSSEAGLNSQFIKNVSINLLSFKWNQHQYFLNTFKHYKTEIEGLKIHFIRKSIEPKENEISIPLLILHPFGMSIWDYYKIIPILTNPSRFNFDFGVKKNIIFDVVIPSIPGFGFSESPKKKGFSFIECGRVMDKLMNRLHIKKYFIHSGGILSNDIAKVMIHYNPNSIRGVHFTNPKVRFNGDVYYFAKYLISEMFTYESSEKGYLTISEKIEQLKKFLSFHIPLIIHPDSISRSLQDSPLGFASYLLEYWSIGTESINSHKHLDGSLMKHYTLDELLTEVHMYWLTKTISSSFRFYYETFTNPLYDKISKAKVSLPVGISIFKNSLLSSNKYMLKDIYLNITRFRDKLDGGEFSMIEEYEKVVEEIFAFVELVLL
ncbi:Epoxide hydrolase 1 [Strongyloides ratti]|uniref:Epoxide hydrolase n=1 Tax=Strongyloides ratti TaxID=34506 RepID=A0A090L7P7_STRRB|nr:Epoxide hydrolase 1 [Strongyloides ratti]CEF65821.1 Epoxide hydrolase 1 [Strongyloides ratti]